MHPRKRRLGLIASLGMIALLGIALLAAAGTAIAQGRELLPAGIAQGTCDKFTIPPQYPLHAVGSGMVANGTPVTTGPQVGQKEDIYPVFDSVTTLDVKLSDILASPHALNVSEMSQNTPQSIACGNIGGTQLGTDLAIGLETQNRSGYSGIALLRANGNQTLVLIFLSQGLSGEEAPAAGTAAAGTAATTSGAATMAVSIKSFAFSPPSLTVAAGTTVTWTNNDSVAHTVTADNGSFDSGQIQPGATYSHTFASAGSVAYHCSNHPFMKATVSVK